MLFLRSFIISCLVSGISLTLDVDDQCELEDGQDGVCLLITDCEPARRLLEKKRFHGFARCGFQNLTEIVCCPQETPGDRFGPSMVTNRPISTVRQPSFPSSDRFSVRTSGAADRECTKYINSMPPPLDTKIIGGEEAIPGEFPHMAAIGYPKGNSGELSFDCGGTLISEYYVLTAAHCIVTLAGIDPTVVRLGVVKLGEKRYNPVTDYNIVNITYHPEYKRPAKYHDIALLRLGKRVPFTGELRPACLYTGQTDPKGNVQVTGWGTTSVSRSDPSPVLLKANLTIVSSAVCDRALSPNNERKLPSGIIPGQMCAGDEDGTKDACQGDSGGPLQGFTDPDSQYRVIGITSYGRACANEIPGVYTRVSQYVDWIENIVWPSNR